MRLLVVVLRDETTPHAAAFHEVALALTVSLTDLGHDAIRTASVPLPVEHTDRRWIVFGCNAFPRIALPADAIIYNMEQVGSPWFTDELISLYDKHVVWEYSAENASKYASIGLGAPEIVPFGYHPVLEHIALSPETGRDIDVLHVGSMNHRRSAVLSALEARGLKVKQLFNAYGAERDAYYARAKIVMNIHYYETAIFEAARVNYLVANGVFVVSETSAGDDAAHIHSVAYDNLVEYVCAVLTHKPELREDVAKLRQDVFRKMPMQTAIESALSRIPKQRPKLVLSMIVKNEAKVIERCLASVRPHVDAWCIVDTGSTDGTQDIIRTFMADTSGWLFEEPWDREDKNRTQAFQHAAELAGKDGYVLWIDADEELCVKAGFDLVGSLHADAHEITVQFGTAFARPQILKADKPWRWVGRVHPYLEAVGAGPAAPLQMSDIHTIPRAEGASWDDVDKFKKHAALFELECKEQPNNPRARYYLAQSYRDAGQSRKAIANYLKRSSMLGWPEETWSAAYEAAKLMEHEDYSVASIVNAYVNAWRARPQRAEALHRLAKYLRLRAEYGTALLFAREAARLPLPDDRLFVERDVYEWRALDELSLAAIYSGAVSEARDAYQKLLLVAPASEHIRLVKNGEHIMR